MPRVFKRNSTGSSPSPTRKSPTSTSWTSPFSSTKRKSEGSGSNARESLTFGQAGAVGTGELPLDNEFCTPVRDVASDGDMSLSTRTPVTVGTFGRMKGRTKGEYLASEPVEYAEMLLRMEMPSLETISDLKVTLRAASKHWLERFYEAGGLTALVMKLSDVESIDEKSELDVQLQVELLKCLKASLNNQQGIDFLVARPEVVGIFALNFGSEDVFICTKALELLAVLMVDGPEGYRAVLAAMDYFKLVKGERVRFYSLLDALASTETRVSFKRDVMLFINTLVNSAMDLEERIEIRADLIYTGILDAVERLKNQSVDDFAEAGDEALSDDRIQLDNQLQVFEAVMNKDVAEVQSTYSGDIINLSDPEALFSTVLTGSIEDDCFGTFLSILQHLVAIPSADLAGKQQWESIEEAVHQIVTHSEDEYSLTYEDLKCMLDWKERLEDLSMKVDKLEKENKTLKEGGVVRKAVPTVAIVPSIPPPPPLPGLSGALPQPGSARGVSAPPPMPGTGQGIPIPPPMPGMGGLPRPPPLPGTGGSLPRPPPLPGMGGPLPMAGAPGAGGLPAPPPMPPRGLRGPGLAVGLLGRGPPPPLAPRSPVGLGNKPKKTNLKSDVALRNLFWNKLQDSKVEGTVWEALDKEMGGTVVEPGDDQKILSDDMRKVLETCFCKNTVKSSGGEDEARIKAEEERKKRANAQINLLDPKVLQNVGIALAKLRMSHAEIKSCVVSLDEKRLDLETVRGLRAQAPSAEDINTLKEFDGDKEKLGKVEKFFLLCMSIPRYTARLDCWVFKLSYASESRALHGTLDTINAACKQVESSDLLLKLMKVILAVGNFLNAGTPRGGAYGFKIDVLKKFSELKDITNKRHLMHYLTEFCQKNDPPLLAVSDGFTDIEEATKIPLSMWMADFANTKKGVTLLQGQIELAKKSPTQPGDRFVEMMEPFLVHALEVQSNLTKKYEETEKRAHRLVESFGESPKKMGVDDFFKELLEFLRRFDRAQAENQARVLKENKLKEKRERAALKKRANMQKHKGLEHKAENLVDNVFGMMKEREAKDILEDIEENDRRTYDARHSMGGESPAELHRRTKSRIKDVVIDDEAALEEEIRRVEKFAANVTNMKRPKEKRTMLDRFIASNSARSSTGGKKREGVGEHLSPGTDMTSASSPEPSLPASKKDFQSGNASISSFLAGKKQKRKVKAATSSTTTAKNS